ncbi:hypothetical protein [Streptomyces malaysiense]|uniref:Peptidase S8/S53 domain-containing protein n=1 Tax=Streptomyces malaysiense TaxID=1428626 RepID=A0A1J4PXT3_9ACTN|nr:hypothetical protein [Streptomyces malaysiense]OIK25733.1 hypothetical protein VT52_019875 [Streptomyces malaysiense]
MRTTNTPHICGRRRRAGSAAWATAQADATTPHKVGARTIAAQVAKAHVRTTNACGTAPEKGYASCDALRVTGGTTAFMEKQATIVKGVAPATIKPDATSGTPTGYGSPDLGTAADEAVKPGAKYVSDSYGGTESSSDTNYLCTARSGYDGPTGLGTPEGTAALPG